MSLELALNFVKLYIELYLLTIVILKLMTGENSKKSQINTTRFTRNGQPSQAPVRYSKRHPNPTPKRSLQED